MNTTYKRNRVCGSWWSKVMIMLIAFHLFSVATTFAQSNGNGRKYTEEHPLVYEDAWDFWPYVFLNEKGEPAGYNVDLLKKVFQELNIPYVIKLKPVEIAFDDLKAGRSDLMFGAKKFLSNGQIHYGKSVVQQFTQSVAYQRGEQPLISTAADLTKHKVYVGKGSFTHHFIKEQGWDSHVALSADIREAVQRVHNEPDCQAVGNTMSLQWLVKTLHFDNIEVSPVKMPHTEYTFASNDSHLLQQMDATFKQLSSDGSLDDLQDKWFSYRQQESGVPFWVWEMIAAFVAIILFSVIYLTLFRRQEKRMTREIRRNNYRLGNILKTSGVHIWILHVASKTVTQYDEYGRESGFDVSLRLFLDNVEPEGARQLVEVLNEIAVSQEKTQTLDVLVEDDEGEYRRNISVCLSVLRRDSVGRPIDIIGTSNDVTDSYNRQKEVKENLLRFHAVFNSSMVDCVTYNADGYAIDMNDNAQRRFPGGLEGAFAKNFRVHDTLGDDMPPIEELQYTYVSCLFQTKRDKRFINKELYEHRMDYELQLVPIRNAEGKLISVYGTGRDISDMVNFYHQQKQNAKKIEALSKDVKNYISNVDYVLAQGRMRMVRYSPYKQLLTIFSGIGEKQDELPLNLVLENIDDNSKEEARQMFKNMDELTHSTQNLILKTTLRTDEGLTQYLYFSFVPTTDGSGAIVDYFGIARDISDIKNTEEQLAVETIRAQEIESVKSSFLKNMSYEIRTPLNSVVGFADLFTMAHDPEDEEFFIQEIKKNSSQLLKLINDILFLSRLDAHMIEFKTQEVDFASFFEPRCEAAWFNNRQEGVDFKVENPYRHLYVDIDEQNVGVVIDKLVANAAEHTTSGQVRIFYDYNGAELAMAFQDTGSGMSKEYLVEIFKRFGNGKNASLGLPICYELVHLMGGDIRVKSEPDKGTIVWVSIPCHCSEIVRK
ncbi:MAG: transporter substrate-binding domain-containing protein [Prevotella sp.]|nr:transporter substrate-binding domain-containing protein [Prevotella sp.]